MSLSDGSKRSTAKRIGPTGPEGLALEAGVEPGLPAGLGSGVGLVADALVGGEIEAEASPDGRSVGFGTIATAV